MPVVTTTLHRINSAHLTRILNFFVTFPTGKKMESNRGEAEKCVEIADQALKAHQLERAKTFLNRAERMYPTQRAKGQ